MGNKRVISIRFHTDGKEADLYRRIQEGREDAGLSAAEYVKQILAGHFLDGKKRNEAEQILREIREEYHDMTGRVERAIRQGMQEHDAVLLAALHKIGGMPVSAETDESGAETAELPEESGEIPEAALDFLERF